MACTPKQLAAGKKYREQNREKLNQWQLDYLKKNPKIREQRNEYSKATYLRTKKRVKYLENRNKALSLELRTLKKQIKELKVK